MIDYNKLKEIIENLSSDIPILVAGHKNTDYDSIGSSYALTLFLNKIGKNAFVLLEEKELDKLDWYKKYDYIVHDYNINDKYNFILLDSNEKSRLGVFEKYFDSANLKINIDHHENNQQEADYIFVDEDISSTSEIIFNLIDLFESSFDEDISSLLYAGIASDTNSFSRRVTTKTMSIASTLLKYNIDGNHIVKCVCNKMTIEESKILADMLNHINYDIFHYIILDRKNKLYKNIDYSVIFKKCMPIINDIEEIKILGIFLIQLDGSITGLFKSNTNIDVDTLAISLGGGGHKKASGFENKMPIEDILKISKKYIKDRKI